MSHSIDRKGKGREADTLKKRQATRARDSASSQPDVGSFHSQQKRTGSYVNPSSPRYSLSRESSASNYLPAASSSKVPIQRFARHVTEVTDEGDGDEDEEEDEDEDGVGFNHKYYDERNVGNLARDNDSEGEMSDASGSDGHAIGRMQYQDDSDARTMSELGGSSSEDDASEDRKQIARQAGQPAEHILKPERRVQDLQNHLKSIPLETLVKAQSKLKKHDQRQDGSSGHTYQDHDVKGGLRNGRREQRRNPEIPITQSQPHQPKFHSGRAQIASRGNKHAPTETTSKKAVSRFRQITEKEKPIVRDPRFDALAGQYDENRFHLAYSFLDDARSNEIRSLRQALFIAKKRHGVVDKDELSAMAKELDRLQSKQAEVERHNRQAQVMSDWKREEGKQRTHGKTSYYLKTGEKKRLVESRRMEELSADKRKLRKVQKRREATEKKRSFTTAPPRRVVD